MYAWVCIELSQHTKHARPIVCSLQCIGKREPLKAVIHRCVDVHAIVRRRDLGAAVGRRVVARVTNVVKVATGVCAKKLVRLTPRSERTKGIASIEPNILSWSSVSIKKMFGVVNAAETTGAITGATAIMARGLQS